ncbi:2,3-diaminopropionate biosynthesis protein SbnB [Fibrella sp. WM1]|uniref:2,3-diaminopropionate biosynthesis protein SbnB n=1 Tax=Fibrella musci TaxID=3242485 RepID=UPI00352145BD
MITYINQYDILSAPLSWPAYTGVIRQALGCISQNDYAQPLKPYLRYGDPQNRIISMPAYVGGGIHRAGIKWIASFPGNHKRQLPRASSVVILNDADTGQPVAIINTALLSVLRTAAVSGLFVQAVAPLFGSRPLRVGITGWGPIGQYHYKMCQALLGEQATSVRVYDTNPELMAQARDAGIDTADSWAEVYDEADLFMACTVAKEPYITHAPKNGSVHLNVSLRDYAPVTIPFFNQHVVVDDWDEVCRENTFVERAYLSGQLQPEQAHSLADVVFSKAITQLPIEGALHFNPMGMAVFDIALGNYILEQMTTDGKGVRLAA